MEYYIVDGELRYIDPDTLQHHGIKGMKWGVRRYQNKDGSLKAAGRIRYGAGKAAEGVKKAVKGAIEKRRAKKAAEKESERIHNLMKKPISRLTESELAERTALANKQKQLRQIESESDKLANNAKSFMARFGSKMINDAVVPAAVNAGKQLVEKFLVKKVSDAMGLSEKDTANAYEALKRVGGDFSKLTDKQVKDLADREKNIKTAKQERKNIDKMDKNAESKPSETKPENKPSETKPENKPSGTKPESKPNSHENTTKRYEQDRSSSPSRFKEEFSSKVLPNDNYQGKHRATTETKLITTKIDDIPKLPAPDLTPDQMLALFKKKKNN